MRIVFDECFPKSKVIQLSATLPKTYAVLDKMCPWMRGKWPTKVHCMSDNKIASMRERGAGHGFTYPGGKSIWLNHYLSQPGYWLVFVHESLHHAWPDMSEDELNCNRLPRVYKAVFSQTLDPEWARKNGVGAPVPNLGDRSFCRR